MAMKVVRQARLELRGGSTPYPLKAPGPCDSRSRSPGQRHRGTTGWPRVSVLASFGTPKDTQGLCSTRVCSRPLD